MKTLIVLTLLAASLPTTLLANDNPPGVAAYAGDGATPAVPENREAADTLVRPSADARNPEPATKAPGLTFAADAFASAPLNSDLFQAVGIGVGGGGRLRYSLSPTTVFAARAAAIAHLPKNHSGVKISYTELLLFGGLEYHPSTFGGRAKAFYLFGDAGAVHIRLSASNGLRASETTFGASAGVGYGLERLELRAGVLVSSLQYVTQSASFVAGATFSL